MENESQQQETEAQETQRQAPEAPQGAANAPEAGAEGGVVDSHGHPGINREKYQRDIEAKDKEIAELKAQVAEAAKTEEGRKALEEKIANLEKASADERETHKLELAGCLNVKAAKALLGDYEGDVAKLKAACPYLFETAKKGATGAKPQGAVDAKSEELSRKAREVLGVREDK